MLHIGWKHENNPRQEGKLGKVVSWQQECKLAAAAGNYDFSLNVSAAQVGGGSTFKWPTITIIRVSKGFLCFEMYRLLSDMQWSIRGDQKTSIVSKINDYELWIWNVQWCWCWCLAFKHLTSNTAISKHFPTLAQILREVLTLPRLGHDRESVGRNFRIKSSLQLISPRHWLQPFTWVPSSSS